MEQEDPKSLRRLQNAQGDTMNLAVNGAVDIDVVATIGRLFQASEVILASDR